VEEVALKITDHEYRLQLTDTIADISESWKKISNDNIYNNTDYLSLLESDGPLGYEYYYALLFERDVLVACFYFQKKTIQLSKDFRIHTHSNKLLQRARVFFLKNLFKFVNHEFLICGNVLLTGEYAYRYNQDISDRLGDRIVSEVIRYIKSLTGRKVKTILQKDFYIDPSMKKVSHKGTDYTEIIVQPDMIVQLNEVWETFEDYLAEVKSKYRVKFKKVKKKAKDLDLLIMTTEDAIQYNDQMYAMYKATADRALFSLFTLDKNYFSRLKETFGDDLTLIGIMNKDRLLGFFTFVKNGKYGDAHFLGYNVKENAKYQLYFNILLRLIKEAIDQKVEYLNLSRTALEIKSSVGAIPYDMKVYVKHTNPLVNKLIPFILSKTVPKNDWVPRSPFSKTT